MTGNQIKGKGFRGALRYNLEKVGKRMAEVLDHSFVNTTEKTIMKEIQMIRILRPNLQKYFYHTSINFPVDENLPNDKMKQIGHDYLKANGFDQHQFIMFRHYDAGHPHLHILVNRIGYDGKVLSDSNDFARSEKVLRELEEKYQLTKVKSSREVRERATTKNELEMMKRTNEPSKKMKLQIIIRTLLEGSPKTTEQFIQAVNDQGINVRFNQATTGFVSGISYDYQGFTIKGAKLGSDFKWPSIRARINYEQERDRSIIQWANDSKLSGHANTGASTDRRLDKISFNKDQPRDRPLFKQVKASKGSNPESSEHDSGTTQGSQSARRTDKGDSLLLEKLKANDLAAFLDLNSGSADNQNQWNIPNELTRKKRKKKKRRRL